MYDKIVVGLKFSDSSIHALLHAIRLAKAHGSFVHIFHALDAKLKAPENENACLMSCTEAEKYFRKTVVPRFEGFEDFRFECSPNSPAIGLCRLAIELSADLIIFGCHQHAEINLGRMDYTGITILEKAPCPVMLIPYRD